MYINPNILEEDWDALGTWADGDINGGVSSISPAGQLYLDDRALTNNGFGKRTKDIGTLGTNDYYLEIRFKGDVWDDYGAGNAGISPRVAGAAQFLRIQWGNGDPTHGDGIVVYNGAAHIKVLAKTWDNDFHTIVLFVHNSQTDVDIWIDKDPTEAADVTDADCSAGPEGSDGDLELYGFGSAAGNGEYHIDYLYVGSSLLAEVIDPVFMGINI